MIRTHSKQKLNQMAHSLRSMAHPDRLKILILLGCERRLAVSEIQRSIGLTQPMTSQHLLSMKRQGVLASRKLKNKVFYFINNKNVLKVITCMDKRAQNPNTETMSSASFR